MKIFDYMNKKNKLIKSKYNAKFILHLLNTGQNFLIIIFSKIIYYLCFVIFK